MNKFTNISSLYTLTIYSQIVPTYYFVKYGVLALHFHVEVEVFNTPFAYSTTYTLRIM